jgi:mono/diheme cytochrome c family protein
MRIPPDVFARCWHDVLLKLKPVAFVARERLFLSRSLPQQKRIGATFMAGGLAAAVPTAFAHSQGYPSKYDFGATADEQEIAAVAIAIPADGKGLPPGKGDYSAGKVVYETACAACHGNGPQRCSRVARYAVGSGAAPHWRAVAHWHRETRW